MESLNCKVNADKSAVYSSQREQGILYNNLGHQQYMKVNFYEAIEYYTKAIQADISLGVAYYNRGTVHYRMGDFIDALKDFTFALKCDPFNQEFELALQKCHKQVTSCAL